jgi:hypothetical protein
MAFTTREMQWVHGSWFLIEFWVSFAPFAGKQMASHNLTVRIGLRWIDKIKIIVFEIESVGVHAKQKLASFTPIYRETPSDQEM